MQGEGRMREENNGTSFHKPFFLFLIYLAVPFSENSFFRVFSISDWIFVAIHFPAWTIWVQYGLMGFVWSAK
jgi:hypothetical protein